MLSRLRGACSPLVLLAVVAFFLPADPARAQGADVDDWRRGDPAVSDDFARNNGQWSVETGNDALLAVRRGRLFVRVPEPELFRWATLEGDDRYSDFYVEVDAERLTGPEDGMVGIIFRYADADNFYVFLASADGYYALIGYIDGELDRLVDWTETDLLETGDGSENRLAVLAAGRELVIFANDNELDRVEDWRLSEGQLALLGGTNADAGLEVAFDNFGLWTPPGDATVGRRSIRRQPTPTPEPPAPATVADAVVASDSLNVRKGPGTNYPVLGALKRGDGVTVIGRTADSKWARLDFAGAAEAWASAQYLTFSIDFPKVAVATAPPTPAAPPAQPRPSTQPKQNLAWLVIENHIGRFITVQLNDKNYRVEGKVGDKPGTYRFELQGPGRYRVAAQLPNGGSHNWDLFVEPTADRCANRQGCIALGQTFLQTYY